MKRPSLASLGSALAETAIILSFTLMVLFGGVQIALVGFMQTQLDAATYMYSHASSLGETNYTDLNSSLAGMFPSLSLSSWGSSNVTSGNPLSTDTSTMPNFIEWGSTTDRYGGASIIRSQLMQTQGTTSVKGLSELGGTVTLNAGMVEGESMVGNHDDDAQGVSYNSSTVYGSLVNPLNLGGTGDDQNVPPYYVAQGFMFYCNEQFDFGTDCEDYTTSLRSLGLAEYLKDDENDDAGNYTTTQVPDDGIGLGGTFATMACHQRIYADLAAAFPSTMPTPSPSPGPNNDWDEQSTGPGTVSAWGGASFQMVYSWDVQGSYTETPGSSTFANEYPLSPQDGCNSSHLYDGVDPGS